MTRWAEVIEKAAKLDRAGRLREGDALCRDLFREAQLSMPNPDLGYGKGTPYSQLEDENDESQEYRDYSSPRRIVPEYKALNGTNDPEEDGSIFDMHGEDQVPGPAFEFPDPTSPSMAGGVDSWTWENGYAANDNSSDGWKNNRPRY